MVRGLRWLRAEQSFDGGVDVSSRGDERLQVGLSVDEAHRAQLFQLLLETHLRSLGLSDERQNGYDKKKNVFIYRHHRVKRNEGSDGRYTKSQRLTSEDFLSQSKCLCSKV